ncbi:MAG: hypothetical protein IPL53_01735 [Ignavibacteria bacterium]|nr:hypothetical protein [Ignavibacteria bacterium]
MATPLNPTAKPRKPVAVGGNEALLKAALVGLLMVSHVIPESVVLRITDKLKLPPTTIPVSEFTNEIDLSKISVFGFTEVQVVPPLVVLNITAVLVAVPPTMIPVLSLKNVHQTKRR